VEIKVTKSLKSYILVNRSKLPYSHQIGLNKYEQQLGNCRFYPNFTRLNSALTEYHLVQLPNAGKAY